MTSEAPSRPCRAPILGLIALLALGLTLTACGSSSSSGDPGSSGAAGASSSSSARYQARLNLAKCLRSQGLDVPDPAPNGGPAGGGGGGRAFRALRDLPPARQQAIRQACSKYFSQAFPFANLTPAQRAQFQQELVKFAECMRSHGVNIPDPTSGGPGAFGIRRAFGSVDRNSPTFQSALKACQGVRPSFRGGPGGPGGG